MKKIILALAVALAIPTVSYPVRKTDEVGAALIIAGGTITVASLSAIGSYLLYKLIRSALTESSEKLYARAERLHQEMVAIYQPLRIQDNLTESDLAALSQESPEVQHAMQAAANYTKLSLMRMTLERRIEQGKLANDPFVIKMQEVADKIKVLEITVRAYDRFWQQYGDYFKTRRFVHQLAQQYSMLDTTERSVRNSVIAYGAQNHLNYPFLTYANDLQAHSKQLSSTLQSVYRYPQLYAQAQRLANTLKNALVILFNAPEYMQEVRLKQQHDLERQRINAELDRARAERERAHAEWQRLQMEHARIEQENERARAELLASISSGIATVVNVHEQAKIEQERIRLEQERQAIAQEKERLRQKEEERLQQERQAVAQEKARLEQERINQQQIYQSMAMPAATYQRPPAYNPEWAQAGLIETPTPSAPPMDMDDESGDHLGD